MLWAVGTSLSSHTDKGSTKGVVIVPPGSAPSSSGGKGGSGSGSSTDPASKELEEQYNALMIAHPTLMILAWGLIAYTAIFYARWFRGKENWFPVHRGLNTLTVIMVFVGFSLAIALKETEAKWKGYPASHFVTDHGRLGLTIVCFLPILVSLAVAHMHPWHRLLAYSSINLAYINFCLKNIPIGISFLVIFNAM